MKTPWAALLNFFFVFRKSDHKALIDDAKSLLDILGDPFDYLETERFKTYQSRLKDLNQKIGLRLTWPFSAIHATPLKELCQILSEIGVPENVKRKYETIYRENSVQNCSEFIFREDGKLQLNDEQIDAAFSMDQTNLVIAGAGSGKTRVITYRVRYLVEVLGVDPSRILVTSFSKKSAGDLNEKLIEISDQLEPRTIHSFAYSILPGKKGLSLDLSDRAQEKVVIDTLVQMAERPETRQKIRKFLSRHFYTLKPLIFYKNKADLYADARRNGLFIRFDMNDVNQYEPFIPTLRGEEVRSLDEKFIADFLYLRGIKYFYEPSYPYLEKGRYRPDFYLPEYEVYLEHYALTSDLTPPPHFRNPTGYLAGIKWKRAVHAHNNTRLIETYSFELFTGTSANDSSEAYLAEKLREFGIETEEINHQDYSALLSDGLKKLFYDFYNSFRISALSFEELRQIATTDSQKSFLELFSEFLIDYQSVTRAQNFTDFNDILISACQIYENGQGPQFDHVIIDEVQDTSRLAMMLVNSIVSQNPDACLFCVGDDWQSIYGFNGSDVNVMRDIASGSRRSTSVKLLSKNFRSRPHIVELGKEFVLQPNSEAIFKPVQASNPPAAEPIIGFIPIEQMADLIRSIPADQSVFVLFRYNKDNPEASLRQELGELSNVEFMTIHSSKGLEADHVFMVFPTSPKRKFPAAIPNHEILLMFPTKTDKALAQEERRLMYVAISRAKETIYFVESPVQQQNPQWKGTQRKRSAVAQPVTTYGEELKILVKEKIAKKYPPPQLPKVPRKRTNSPIQPRTNKAKSETAVL